MVFKIGHPIFKFEVSIGSMKIKVGQLVQDMYTDIERKRDQKSLRNGHFPNCRMDEEPKSQSLEI